MADCECIKRSFTRRVPFVIAPLATHVSMFRRPLTCLQIIIPGSSAAAVGYGVTDHHVHGKVDPITNQEVA
jgi:hypothetical protein